jgi:hypothetical protein
MGNRYWTPRPFSRSEISHSAPAAGRFLTDRRLFFDRSDHRHHALVDGQERCVPFHVGIG